MSRGGKVTTRRTAPKSSLSSAKPASSLSKDNNLNIADFHAGDKVTHDQYGLGTVVDTQDKGRNSVITVDFGSSGVKRFAPPPASGRMVVGPYRRMTGAYMKSVEKSRLVFPGNG